MLLDLNISLELAITIIAGLSGLTFAAGQYVNKLHRHKNDSDELAEEVSELQEAGSPVILEKLNGLEHRIERIESILMDYLPAMVEERLERGEPLHFRRRRGTDENQ